MTPEWGSKELLIVRRIARANGTPEEAAEALAQIGSPIQVSTLRGRATRYNIIFLRRGSSHAGTSNLTAGDGTTKRDRDNERRRARRATVEKARQS